MRDTNQDAESGHKVHDQFFRAVFSDPVAQRDLLRVCVPDVVADTDTTVVTAIDASFTGGRAADLLLSVRNPGGGEHFVYILVEHKSYHGEEPWASPTALTELQRRSHDSPLSSPVELRYRLIDLRQAVPLEYRVATHTLAALITLRAVACELRQSEMTFLRYFERHARPDTFVLLAGPATGNGLTRNETRGSRADAAVG